MECQSSDSKKLYKVFDASTKHKRTRKKHDGLDDTNSLATDDSASGGRAGGVSPKISLQEIPTAHTLAADENNGKRDRDSSPSVSPARGDRRTCRSPRRHRRSIKDGLSLALKSGLVSTPRSTSPRQNQNADGVIESIPKDQDSFIYTFLEETMKNYKKKQRHARRHEDRRHSGDRREASGSRERHRHHHRRRNEVPSKDRARDKVKSRKEENSSSAYQNMLLETFAKLCAQMNEKTVASHEPAVPRTLSHKSLQCEVISRRDANDVDYHPVRLRSNDHSPGNVSKIRSHDDFRGRLYSHEKFPINQHPEKQDKCLCCYDKGPQNQYSSKINVTSSKMRNLPDDGYPPYPDHMPSRNNLDNCYRSRGPDPREFRNCDRDYVPDRHYENEKRRYYDQKTSRSYEARREGYPDTREDDKYFRRTARSDNVKEKHYDERDKYYDEKVEVLERDRYVSSKDRRAKQRIIDRCDRNSVVSRDDDRERDRFSERERDSGLSVADGETSTVSGKSNYLRVVKQEIAEQRETMDKMMKLWKELMRCFKGLSTQNQNKSVQDSAANVQESAAAQLRLWRECMHRYETVARDVGDTDARLMEEINKQRSEMAEMASMWQECLQRYRDMSSDFNSLKQQVTVTKQQFPETPTRQAPTVPLACAEGEGSVPPVPYRLPNHYPQMPPMGGYPAVGSPLRSRASAPPAWWWCGERGSPRRRSSPESRGSRERRHRHKERDRDDSRYKEKSSKPSGARSEHRHRKR